jgi:biopolymer transport protein ExbD
MEKPAEDVYRSFTLRNNSAKSIPLQIPGVMNPNLSPFSNSGVDLKMGQEIFFTYKGKKRILLIVDENINHGDVVDVSKLLKERKKEIDASAGSARE